MWYKGVAISADARVSKSQCRDSLFSTLKVTLLCDSLVCGSLTDARWWLVNKSQGCRLTQTEMTLNACLQTPII